MTNPPFRIVLLQFGLLLSFFQFSLRADVKDVVTMETDNGVLEFELFKDVCPKTVANFKYLADTRFYDGTAFHRIINNFMAQGGDPYTRGSVLLGVATTAGGTQATFESYRGNLAVGMAISGIGIPANTTVTGFSSNPNSTGNLGSPNYIVTLSNAATKTAAYTQVDGRISLFLTSITSSSYGGGGPGYTIPDEFSTDASRNHVRGVLSMAHSDAANSGGSQFFVMLADAPNLDGSYTSFGSLTATTTNATTLAKFDSENLILNSGSTEISVPTRRVVLKSVRIHSQLTDTVLASQYPVASVAGLLRNGNRQERADSHILGTYQISLSARGTFSGKLQYFGRTIPFVGTLSQDATYGNESEGVILTDSKTSVPVRIRVRLRRTATTGGTLSVLVCSVNSDGTDNADTTQGTAACELTHPTLPTDRYTTSLSRPGYAANNNYYFFTNVSGFGYLTARYLKASGLCVVSGKLADNTAVTCSSTVTTEGSRVVLPVNLLTFTKEVNVYRSQFSAFSLLWWPMLNRSFQLCGGLELNATPDPSSLDPSGSRYLYWYRAAQTVGVVKDEVGGYLLSTTAPWKPPVVGALLPTFLISGGSFGTLQPGTLTTGSFKVSKANTSTLFTDKTLGYTLTFSPSDGTFSGTFLDRSGSAVVRRTFQGVCVSGGTTYSEMQGFSLGNSSSLPVVISAP
jgi:cyclophilin family peptidyl-prolyl cis-trans isomerase